MKRSLRILAIVALLLLAIGAARGQGTLQFAELGDYHLESGQVIQDCRVGYRTFGNLNSDKSNALLFPTWFSGTSQELADLGFIGPGKLADSSRYFVVAVDAFGNAVSSSPSTSKRQPGEAFPRFTIRDMVHAQHLLLTRFLNLTRLHAVMGISMGGMQTFQWIVSYPRFMEKAVAIVGSPRLTSYDLLLWQSHLMAIQSTRGISRGDKLAMQAIAAIHARASRTPRYFATHIAPREFAQFLAKSEKSLARFSVVDWAWQVRAMMDHDIYGPFGNSAPQAAQAVRAHVLVVTAQQDGMVYPSPAQELARILKAEAFELAGDCGHLAFFCEGETLRKTVHLFLNKDSTARAVQ